MIHHKIAEQEGDLEALTEDGKIAIAESGIFPDGDHYENYIAVVAASAAAIKRHINDALIHIGGKVDFRLLRPSDALLLSAHHYVESETPRKSISPK